jgi:uncharacterized membrane protein (DUF4010 family)
LTPQSINGINNIYRLKQIMSVLTNLDTTALPRIEWPYLDILVRLVLALALGLLIGLERERRGKEAGLRTFGFTALLGAMGGSMGEPFALTCLFLVSLLVVFLNLQTIKIGQGTELTTSASLLVTAMAGILCGQGHTISPAAVMVLATALLAWKERLTGFTMGLTEGELRSALLLAILAIVIYPALPTEAVGPYNLIEPREAWVSVLLIAGIGSVNYVLWKLYGERGIDISGFLGGLINSNFTIIELTRYVKESNGQGWQMARRGILIATTAMLARNGTLLAVLAPVALKGAALPLAAMCLVSVCLVLFGIRFGMVQQSEDESLQISYDLPFSLPIALRYGALFLVLHVASKIAQQTFGDGGFYVVSALGGLLSSASAVASAAALAASGGLNPATAGEGAIIASIASIVFSLSFVLRCGQSRLIRSICITSLLPVATGLVCIWLQHL